MPTILQLRRGSTAENDAYTGSVGEITVDTTLNTVRLHDGSTAGGSLVGNLQKNIQLGITGNNEIDTSSGNLTIDSAGGTVTIDDNLNISGTTTVSGHILPDADVTYDLGSSSFKFRDIYLSGTSINLGDATITASGSSIVLPSGSAISGGSGDVVDLNSSQTLTNKTLTSPVISTISNSGTVTIPTGTVTLASTSYVDTAVANVIDSAPGALDTLNELAAALGDDASYASTTTTALSNRLRIDTNAQGLTSTQKSNAITNLGLSTVATSGSYTDLSNTSSVVTLSGNQTLTNKSGNISQWTNDSGYLTSFTETNDLTASVTWDNVPNAYITQSSVTQHQAALSITESQISDLGSYITASSSDILTNKTLDDATLTGTLTAGGGVGTSGQVLKSTGTGVEWTSLTDNDTNTTYNVSAVDSGDNAIIRLTGSDASTDDVTLAAGSNITITPSGDTITIASTASGSTLTIQDEGSTLTTDATTLNFVGAGVTASGTGSTKIITIPGGSSYTDSDVNTHLNTSTASSGEVLSWNGSDYDWVAQSGGGGGLSNIVEDTTPQLGGTLDANGNTIDMGTNTITDTKVGNWDTAYGWGNHSAQGYLTTTNINTSTSGSNALITLTNSAGGSDSVTLAAGSNITISQSSDTITIASTASGSSYTDSDVNTHLNTSTASSGEVLSWNGSDYDWVAQSGGGSSLTIQDEGSTLTTDATTLNFVGAGVTASGSGSTKTITISGGASTIGALNDVTITSPALNQVLKYNGSAWVNAADATGSGSADLGAVAEDILPSFDEIYDIGSSTFKWYDGFFTNSINLDTIALTNSSGTLSINSDVIVGSLLVDSLLLSENTITADASTALQYLGDKGVVEINSSNLDVREGDWIGVPVVETTNSVPPLTTGAEGIIRYNKDEGRFEGYSAEGWASLGGLEKNDDGDSIITGNLIVSGDITSTSDETLKDNIKSIEGALDIVTKLSGKMFTMKSDETQKEKVGFIAQEIEQHLPQVVSTDPNGIKSVSYGNVAALLVEAIKELNQKIEDLKK